MVEGADSYSYAQVAEHLAKFTKALAQEGVRPGAIVGVNCAGPYLLLLLTLACEVIGATHVSLAEAEMKPTGAMARRCGLFLAERVPDGLSAVAKVVKIDSDFVGRALRLPISADDMMQLQTSHGPDIGVRIAKTSGSTGAFKYMLKTAAMVGGAVESYDVALRPLSKTNIYVCAYTTNINGVYTDVVRALNFGNKIIFISSVLEIMNIADGTDHYAFLLVKDAKLLANECIRSGVRLNMYYVDITGAGVPSALQEKLTRAVSTQVRNVYSSNEAPSIAFVEEANRYTLVPGVDVEIVDDQGRPRPPGAPGQIRVRSPYIVTGYLWDEDLSARHFQDGWFLMNDIGYLPEPGKLVVLGRSDDMLNIGGEKCAPYPFEQALKSIDGVTDAALVLIETGDSKEVVCAAIECDPARNNAALRTEIAHLLSAHLEAFALHFERQFPRTETGKVQRNILQARIKAKSDIQARTAPGANAAAD